MSRLIAFCCNDDHLTHDAIRSATSDLQLEERVEPQQCGVGWLQDDRTLLKHNPRGIDGTTFARSLADIRSRSILVHLGEPEIPTSQQTVQPFRFRRWIFGACGEMTHDSDLCEAIAEGLPDFIRGKKRKVGSHERIFQRFLGHLHR